jgi:CRISPR-associated endonuclease/helicase Cas3
MTFDEFFKNATKLEGGPYPFQREFAEAEDLYQLADVPTGLGKTALVVLGWLWRRFHAQDATKTATPRRLVYCLPMRVLVEQTTENARKWLKNLLAAGALQKDVPIHVLMGGEEQTDWAMCPEREMILIGTQDLLLSRALNRGYAASRARWPMEFGLLHNDCLWVFDEIQLMGPGLATTTQLEAFRYLLGSKDGHGCQSVWMSATLEPKWLETVDFKECVQKLSTLKLTGADHNNQEVQRRWNAKKPLKPIDACMGDTKTLVLEIRDSHRPESRTTVIVNTVRRACDLYQALSKDRLQPILLHSRFRPDDRKAQIDKALADPPAEGTIIVSTQVIEAGVDISATTLWTEVAPWASLVQRFGRCNRKGLEDNQAQVFWIRLPKDAKEQAKVQAPYELDELIGAANLLQDLRDVGLKSLPMVPLDFQHTHVLRRKDLIDLYDTTPDLGGNDIDIDRFIRDVEETDVRVFWRSWDQPHRNDAPPNGQPPPQRDELCPAPVSEFRDFTKKHVGKVWRWDFLEKQWNKADAVRIVAGHVYLIHSEAGGYVVDRGWAPESPERVEPVVTLGKTTAPDANEEDIYSRIHIWQTIAEHSERVHNHLNTILRGLFIDSADALQHAARWHDRGKVHEVFIKALPDSPPAHDKHWAKAPGTWKRYERRHFRHELASTLAILDPSNQGIPNDLRDLVAYLVAAHHGKVRLSIRSMPNETRPAKDRRFARGVWDGDVLPETDLGGGIVAPAVTLSLEPMELGLCEQEPFKGQPSWAERMIRLRDRLGPFRLAYLEALLRAADWRASQPENPP